MFKIDLVTYGSQSSSGCKPPGRGVLSHRLVNLTSRLEQSLGLADDRTVIVDSDDAQRGGPQIDAQHTSL